MANMRNEGKDVLRIKLVYLEERWARVQAGLARVL